jgi:hypothetical protein
VIIKLSWTIHGVWETFPGLLLKPLWPIDKNNLSPLRLLPFFAMVVIVAAHVPRDAKLLASRAALPLVLSGRQSLEIFCLGILLSALGHFILAEVSGSVPMQLTVTVAGIAIMVMTAKLLDWYKALDRAPARPIPAVDAGDRALR